MNEGTPWDHLYALRFRRDASGIVMRHWLHAVRRTLETAAHHEDARRSRRTWTARQRSEYQWTADLLAGPIAQQTLTDAEAAYAAHRASVPARVPRAARPRARALWEIYADAIAGAA